MKSRQYQSGITMIGFLFVLIISGFLGLLVIRLIPVYLQDYAISSSLNSLATETISATEANGNLTGFVKQKLIKRFAVNNISAIKADQVEIIPAGNNVSIRADYEARTHFISNINLIINFEHSVMVPIK